MSLNAQGSKEQSVASAMKIQQELEISFTFEVREDSDWRSWGGGDSVGLIVSSWSLGLELLHLTALIC